MIRACFSVPPRRSRGARFRSVDAAWPCPCRETRRKEEDVVKKPLRRKRPAKKATTKPAPAKRDSRPALRLDHSQMDHGAMPEPSPATPTETPDADEHSQIDHSAMRDGSTGHARHGHADHGAMTGALGPYPMERESSALRGSPIIRAHRLMSESGDGCYGPRRAQPGLRPSVRPAARAPTGVRVGHADGHGTAPASAMARCN